jgi:L-rhamnose isomerase/sugar isomerase|tara:strand:- start:455 stop:700 length:246 start_codon:yes stop_codon:yes gene_type:complete
MGRALLVDRQALEVAQGDDKAVGREENLRVANNTDVRPLLVQVRIEQGAEINLLGSYRSSSYPARIAAERQGELEDAVSWG